MTEVELRQAIAGALTRFQTEPLSDAATHLWDVLGYASKKRLALKPNTLSNFLSMFSHGRTLNDRYAKPDDWKSVDLLFQLTDEEIRTSANQQFNFESKGAYNGSIINSYLFFAIELKGSHYSRSTLAGITREVNKLFDMPALILFRHGETLTLAIINRRLHKREAGKDVLEKVTLIQDIQLTNTHRAHIDILTDLSLGALHRRHPFTNFVGLHEAWQKTLDTSELNKRFFQDLANWYFWALPQVHFPKEAPKDADGQDSLSLIRLITRVIFCWFLKEKGLLPEALFDEHNIPALLTDLGPKESTYYKAILQNLFFATLNQEMDKREFRRSGQNFMAHNLYRYKNLLKTPNETLKLLAEIPFMNGGLFECLDKTEGTRDKPQYIRVDGFSDREDNVLKVPNDLFWGPERVVDLSEAYGESRFKSSKVAGLVRIFNRYKFTVAENTPIEEEVALDPELLGRVFENLLAAYNPETGATARKQTGSFYTPREIVNYMVDESLIASLKTKLAEALPKSAKTEVRLRHLFAYNDQPHEFAETEVVELIKVIDHLTILDPACGSGAFPMGILHKLVFVLAKLDPGNQRWKARQLAKANEIPDYTVRERVLADIEQTFGANELDYGRKLYLIENCIYGVDIQPIAVQISKLRFFISLVVEQTVHLRTENRGIRPLPNLETKFVAANTLIGVQRPGQQLLRDLNVQAKETELHRVRERHFLARTPTTKAKYRDEDARLRFELAEMLKSDGWNPEIAKMLAGWDPYDQNASAPFFDTEWMFGIQTGFDICIGNPPYGANIDRFVLLFQQLYPNTTKAFKDIYKLFIEVALVTLLKTDGILCYITPNTLLRQPRYKDARSFLDLYRVEQVIDFGLGVFEQIVPTCVFLVGNSNNGNKNVRYVDLTEGSRFTGDLNAEHPRFIEQKKLLDLSYSRDESVNTIACGGSLSALGEVLDLKDAGINYQRVNVGLGEKGKSDLGQRLLYEGRRESVADVEYWKGEDISKFYVSQDTGRFVRTNTTKSLRANERVVLNKEYFARAPKLIWRQTAPCLIAAVDDKGIWFGRSIQGATVRTAFRHLDLYYLAGLLNSAYLRYVYNLRVQEQGRVFPQVKFENIRPLPLAVVARSEQIKIIELVQRAIAAKKTDQAVDNSDIQRDIDGEVYRLYGLNPSQIEIVENAAPSGA